MTNSFFKFGILFFLTFSLFFSSCAEEEEPNEPDEISQLTSEYYPLTEGSWWEYESETFFDDPYTYRTMVSTETKILNGNEYVKLEIDWEGAESHFYRCDESNCYENGNSSILGQNYEWPFLKNDAPAGTTWTFDYNYDGNPNQYFMTIEETGLSRTVKGIEYTDVIKVKRQHYYNNPFDGVWTEGSEDYSWYAKGIGKIESNDFLGLNTYLLDYEIK